MAITGRTAALRIGRHLVGGGRGWVSLAILLAVLAAGCAGGAARGRGDDAAVRVVATTTVLADLVAQVGGARVSVSSLVPAGGEVHTFDPSPGDVASVADADLIVLNGLGLDDWAAELLEGSDTTAVVVELGEDLEGVEYLTGGEHEDAGGEHEDAGGAHEDAGGEHEAESVNPHLWLNVEYAARYVDRIEQALAGIDGRHADAYRANGERYRAELRALHEAIADRMAAIPAEDRRIVSFHEAFPYFAAAYGLQVIGVVVDAPGQDPSAGEIAALVAAIRESGARAVFGEAQFNPRLAEAIAREAGVAVETRLYNDSLGEPPADTYVGMMRHNADRIEAALR